MRNHYGFGVGSGKMHHYWDLSYHRDLRKLEMVGSWGRTKNEVNKTSRVQNLRRHSLSGFYKCSTNTVVFWIEFLSSPLSSLLPWKIQEHRSGSLVQVLAILATKQSLTVSTFIFCTNNHTSIYPYWRCSKENNSHYMVYGRSNRVRNRRLGFFPNPPMTVRRERRGV